MWSLCPDSKRKMKLNVYIGSVVWMALSVLTVILSKQMICRRSEQEYHIRDVGVAAFFLMFSLLIGVETTLKSESKEMWFVLLFSYLAVLAAAQIDMKLYIIPNEIPVFLFGCKLLVLVLMFFLDESVKEEIIGSLLGCIICFIILTIAGLCSHGGIGKGDIKLLSALGFACGAYPVFVTLTGALICCSAVALLLIILKKVSWKEHFPFAPFIYLGYLIMIVYI